MKTPPKPLRHSQAFTLVELLVVIGIIAVLAALSLTGYRMGINKVRTVRTLDNMRQLATATIGYTTDNNGFAPLGDAGGTGGGRGIIWLNQIAPNLGYPQLEEQLLNKPRDGMDQWEYMLTTYKDAPFICGGLVGPELEKTKSATTDAIGGIGYNATPWLPENANANAVWNVGAGPFKAPPKLMAITRTSTRCMYACSYDWHLFNNPGTRAYDRFGKNKSAMVTWDGSGRLVNKTEYNKSIDNPKGR